MQCKLIRVGKTGYLGPWSKVIVYRSKLSFCQNDPSMGVILAKKENLLQHTMTLLQGPKDPVLPTLTYTALSLNVLVVKRLGYIYFTLYKLINIILNEIKNLNCRKEKKYLQCNQKNWPGTQPRQSEISMKNWRAKVKPVLIPNLWYKSMLKVWRKLWEPFRIYR